ncbi:tripartite tricarboxylate transporter TctB family protein [Paeniroseomonas aquatica]|uniref:tripartite tricarboxylate transporter TctB family protein n=1 Tax=Paeniroseomonas aquatica TaxID=373043 RepID=UPI00360975AC
MRPGAALWDSLRLGIGWGTDGPQSGTFPFWIGLALVAASTGTLVQAARTRGELGIFASWPQLRLVASVLVPNILYVAAIPFAGIYVASAVMVAWFMRRLGASAGPGRSWRASPRRSPPSSSSRSGSWSRCPRGRSRPRWGIEPWKNSAC